MVSLFYLPETFLSSGKFSSSAFICTLFCFKPCTKMSKSIYWLNICYLYIKHLVCFSYIFIYFTYFFILILKYTLPFIFCGWIKSLLLLVPFKMPLFHYLFSNFFLLILVVFHLWSCVLCPSLALLIFFYFPVGGINGSWVYFYFFLQMRAFLYVFIPELKHVCPCLQYPQIVSTYMAIDLFLLEPKVFSWIQLNFHL